MSGMDKILSINGKWSSLSRTRKLSEATNLVDDSDLVCQPGARWEDINDVLREKKIPLFFPVCQMFW
jgi:D-lactate dehydrogenase (cytochrome)